LETGGWGLGDEGVPAADACEHHSLNLSSGSRRPTNREKEFSFLNGRRGNLYENKGPSFSSPEQSGNVIENKGSYALKARMLLKRKVVSVW
jgi:hypothetical protein